MAAVRPYRWLAERSVRKGRRKLIHRESFRASVLHLSEIPAVLAKHCGEEVSLDNAFVLIERHPNLARRLRACHPRGRCSSRSSSTAWRNELHPARLG